MATPTFRSKIWKAAAISSYLGMHMATILITAVVPLSFICMGARTADEIATHSQSLRKISYWLIGLGGITFIVSTLALISTFSNNRKFRIVVTCFVSINVLLTVILMIWGLIPTDSRKDYMRMAWDDMEKTTKEAIQEHYSCCGFENPEFTSLINCYADETLKVYWPDGCYDRITSYNVPAPSVKMPDGETVTLGTMKTNVFLLGFLLSFVFVIFTQSMITTIFIVGLIKPQIPHRNDTKKPEVYENGAASEHDSTVEDSTTKIQSISIAVDTVDTVPDVEVRDDRKSDESEKKWYQKIPDFITTSLESGFFWLGVKVGHNPKMTILLSILLAVTMSLGLLQRQDQPAGSSGFLPADSYAIKEFIEYSMSFRDGSEREHYMIVVDDDNLLKENKFKAMSDIDTSVRNINDSKGQYFADICSRLAGECEERSLFEFWAYNATAINQLTTDDILLKVNKNMTSPIFGDQVDVTTILGGISRTPSNAISGAGAHIMRYVTARRNDDWELQFVEIGRANYDGFSVYVNARGSRSFENSSYTRELPLLFGGFGLIFIYIILMTGKLSLLEHRTYIALMGIFTAGLSMAAGIGLSASLGFDWSVIHLVAPFLVIGIGVDDMFILIQAWNAVDDDPELKKKSLPEKAGYALKSAGVSITVTSVTDLVAFAVGASSELGSFASFSVYVAICIILLFFLQCTLFLACTILDQRRREERYDACLACCYKHDESYKPSKCSQRELFQTFFEDVLGRVVQYLPVQIFAILFTVGLTGLMAWGFTQLKVSFDPDWYLPTGSYVVDFNDQFEKYYSGGQEASVAVIGADFYEEREKLHLLYERLRTNQNLNPKYLRSWFENYVYWMNAEKNISDIYSVDAFADPMQFYASVGEFLRGRGKIFSSDVTINRTGILTASKFQIRHKLVTDGVENVDIMDSVRDDCASIEFSSWAFPYHRRYFNFVIMKIIRREVYRNLGITLLCVFIMVLPMIASIQMSFWVVLCVVFTIIDVAGSMYFAGLTIETSTIITLLLSVGLAVDYAAHIAHKFLTLKGTRKMRVRVTLGQIGPAVFNGGFSTFLALVLLAGSDTYSYKVFFTVFVCVVAYGLWNGLIFLPCLLGLLGPDPHVTAVEARLTQRHYQRKNKVETEEGPDELQMTNSIERT